mgnify:CR=1 FL=1
MLNLATCKIILFSGVKSVMLELVNLIRYRFVLYLGVWLIVSKRDCSEACFKTIKRELRKLKHDHETLVDCLPILYIRLSSGVSKINGRFDILGKCFICLYWSMCFGDSEKYTDTLSMIKWILSEERSYNTKA